MFIKWAILVAALTLMGCGASTPVSTQPLIATKPDEASAGTFKLSAFEGTRTSKMVGLPVPASTCEISLLPTSTREYWVFSHHGEKRECSAATVVVDSDGELIRVDYIELQTAAERAREWATPQELFPLMVEGSLASLRRAIPSPVVRAAPIGESLLDVDGRRTLIRKNESAEGLNVWEQPREPNKNPLTLVVENTYFIPRGEQWVKEATHVSMIVEKTDGKTQQDVSQVYRSTDLIAKICEDGAPEECPALANAAWSFGEKQMAQRLAQAGCAQNHDQSCQLLEKYKK